MRKTAFDKQQQLFINSPLGLVTFQSRKIIYAADSWLNDLFDVMEMEFMLLTTLWCTHPDRARRPVAELGGGEGVGAMAPLTKKTNLIAPLGLC